MIDDSDLIRKLVGKLLTGLGASVRSFESGELAVRLWETSVTSTPLFVLVDEDMPGMSGVETVRGLRGAGLPCPIFLHTGSPTEDVREAAAAAGFDGMLAKPVQKDALAELLAYYAPHRTEARN